MECGCSGARRGGHTRWTCQVCWAVVAEGCVDVDRWHAVTTPVGLPQELRWAVADDL